MSNNPSPEQMEQNKEAFIGIFQENIKKEGADKLLEFLEKSDFFTAPASVRFHGSYPGGLCEHSLNVYRCLKSYLEHAGKEYGITASEETIATVALLHDLCKVNLYRPGKRNVKENGIWKEMDSYEYDDRLPYGHGEKSVYIINGFIRGLTRDEAIAIRFHMGFSGSEEKNLVSKAFDLHPLAFALSTADMEATFFLEGKQP